MLIAIPGICQISVTNFDHLSSSDGLSDNNVETIFQDSKGFMWFGTRNGLNKFDGNHFKSFTMDPNNPNTISNNVIWDIHEFQQQLWIATEQGLNVLESDGNRFRRFLPSNDQQGKSVNYGFIKTLETNHDGKLWVGTNGGGINIYDGESFEYKTSLNYPTLKSDFIQDLFLDSRNIMWVADLTGLYFWDSQISDFKSIEILGRIECITEGPDNFIWVASTYGIFKVDPETLTTQHFTVESGPIKLNSNEIMSLHFSNQELWIGSRRGGLSVFDLQTQKTTISLHETNPNYGLSSNEIWDIYESRDGVIWIGTYRGGVNLIKSNQSNFEQLRFTNIKDNNPSGSVMNIMVDKNDATWFGLDGGGIIKLDQNDDLKHWKYQENNKSSLFSNTILTLHETTNEIWIGTFNNGLGYFNKSSKTFHTFNLPILPGSENSPVTVWDLETDQNNNLWIATMNRGAFKYSLTDKSVENIIIKEAGTTKNSSHNNVWSILNDSKGNVWLGTHDGVVRIDSETQEQKTYYNDPSNPESLNNNWVHVIFEDSNGTIWVGTHGGGLNELIDSTQTFRHYTVADGLSNSVIFGILEDENKRLWLSSDYGISRLDLQTKEIKAFKAQGMKSQDFNLGAFCKKPNGNLLFGNLAGYIEFDPSNLTQNQYNAPLAISGFGAGRNYKNQADAQFDSLINLEKPIILEPNENSIFIEFALLSYFNSDDNLYSYKLEGYDSTWSAPTANNQVTFTSLPPGEYSFHVKGRNYDGYWIDQEASVQFTIIPPWWQTGTIKAIGGFFLVALLYFLFKSRTSYLEGQKDKLEKMVQKKTSEVEEQNKKIIESNHKLQDSLAYLKETQDQLVASEKITAFTQVVFNLLHELNSPLGATKSGLELTKNELFIELDEIPNLLREIEMGELDIFKGFIKEVIENSIYPTSPKFKETLMRQLGDDLKSAGVTEEKITEKLISMDCFELGENGVKLVQSPNCCKMLDAAENIIYKYRNILTMEKSAQRSISILNSLKPYDTQNFDSFSSTIDVVESIELVLSEKAHMLGDSISLETIWKTFPKVKGNEEQMTQIWLNLITNAIHAMKGEGILSIEVKSNLSSAIIKVTDTGSGIPKNLQKRIFEPFYTTKPLGEGRGIGLDIVSRVLKKHHGDIQLQSSPGKTVFTITLPLEEMGKVVKKNGV
jgi:ligand-binding sensor domain-containing protein/signal transduction histidine kinase